MKRQEFQVFTKKKTESLFVQFASPIPPGTVGKAICGWSAACPVEWDTIRPVPILLHDREANASPTVGWMLSS